MPIYEYRCNKCGKEFEVEQRISEPAKKKCPSCGAMALERLISPTAFHLKGGGWYKDLYSSPKPGAKSGSESGSGSGSGSGSDSGTGSGSGSGSSSAEKPAASDKSDKKSKGKGKDA